MKILLIIFLFISCSTPKPCNPWPSADVSYQFAAGFGEGFEGITHEQAKQEFRKAAKVWSNSGIRLTEAIGADIVINERGLHGRFLGRGQYPDQGGQIFMDNSERLWTVELFYKVALHEFGHALGFRHEKSATSIMYYKVGKFSKLSKYDKERVLKAYKGVL